MRNPSPSLSRRDLMHPNKLGFIATAGAVAVMLAIMLSSFDYRSIARDLANHGTVAAHTPQ